MPPSPRFFSSGVGVVSESGLVGDRCFLPSPAVSILLRPCTLQLRVKRSPRLSRSAGASSIMSLDLPLALGLAFGGGDELLFAGVKTAFGGGGVSLRGGGLCLITRRRPLRRRMSLFTLLLAGGRGGVVLLLLAGGRTLTSSMIAWARGPGSRMSCEPSAMLWRGMKPIAA